MNVNEVFALATAALDDVAQSMALVIEISDSIPDDASQEELDAAQRSATEAIVRARHAAGALYFLLNQFADVDEIDAAEQSEAADEAADVADDAADVADDFDGREA